MVGRTFSASSRGTFTRTVSPLPSVQMTRTCSQRSPFAAGVAELVDSADFAGAAVACAKAPSGARTSAAAKSAPLANRLSVRTHFTALRRLDMAECLLAGTFPGCCREVRTRPAESFQKKRPNSRPSPPQGPAFFAHDQDFQPRSAIILQMRL